MSLADLLHTLEQNTTAEIRSLLAQAESKAATRDTEASLAQERQLALALEEARATVQASVDADLAAAHREARATTLAARASMLERVRVAVQTQLPTYASRVMSVLAAHAIACAKSEPGAIRCPSEFVDEVRAMSPATLRVEASSDVDTGVIIELDNGTRIVATLDALFEREAARLETSLLARLEPAP